MLELIAELSLLSPFYWVFSYIERKANQHTGQFMVNVQGRNTYNPEIVCDMLAFLRI